MWFIVKEWLTYTFGNLFGFMEYLDKVFVFWTFLAIAIASGGLLLATFIIGEVSELLGDIFGGAGDTDHDLGHGADTDVGADHDVDHDFGHLDSDMAGLSSPSFLSFRILLAFFAGFGVTGAIATHYKEAVIVSSLYGLAVGTVLMILMYLFVALLASQQASFNVSEKDFIGKEGYVTVEVPIGGLGQVLLDTGAGSITKLCRAINDELIPERSVVKIERTLGGVVLVSRVKTDPVGQEKRPTP
ncbi:MAG: hypothetical protein HYW89_01765 [Candidatus Sungiibacteriota bacterium]|uniref:NfeD-like C-terminal domain-containing protein n=1 Tax=Candidatus Sungiibacteriota bacterium TaxID=2750080 RepID=A0A7T5RK76_9BACT|nr:MAG: hypothetical protein HYW89_01765 [Candidatus Sungbacteria bacterium]